MENIIKDIWIESEVKGNIIGGEKFINDNSDVIVTFSDDKKYVATFFTYENIQHLRSKNKATGECLNGKYFWASDMIIVDRIERKDILQVIEELLAKEEFYQIFKSINS